MTDDQLARRYLLGTLDGEEQREQVEDRLLADPGFAALLESVERDLYDEFASGTFRGEELARFRLYMESHPDSARKIRFATAWSKRRKAAASPMLRWMMAAAAALVLMIGGGVWLMTQQGPEQELVALALQPGTQRSAGDRAQTVRIPASAVWVRIELAEAGPARSVVVRFVDTGVEVWRGEVASGSAKVPALRLAVGDHVLATLDGSGQELADYVFRVTR